MSKARDIADLVSAGSILADGAIATTEITGVTATSAELNILDGVTATASELNALDGITATATELNYTSGVTSAIQTQLNAKAPTANPTFTGDATFATDTLFVDESSGEIGINTTSPVSNLQVRGNGASGDSTISITSSSANSSILNLGDSFDVDIGQIKYSNSSDSMQFITGTVQRMLINSSGIDVTGELIADSYNETYAAVTSTSNATTVDCEAGNAFSHTLTENTTFTFSNPPASGTAYSFSIEIIQDASASGFTVTWPTSVDWPSATAPTLTATASAKDVRDGGTNWYGFTAGQALG
jgi:hypothetical protein